MEFLFPNYPPLKTKYSNFYDTFFDLLSQAEETNIAVGYITADSIAELKNTLESNTLRKLNLTIGMHYFEQFTKLEYLAAMQLHKFLKDNGIGAVRLVTPFKFHGKLYSFADANKSVTGIIGSNNLSSITAGYRNYEASMLIKDKATTKKLDDFIGRLNREAASPIDELEITEFRENRSPLENHEHVRRVSNSELAACLMQKTEVIFEVPIKAKPKSNLNVFFGKGRLSKNGLLKPRPWYEVEVIPGKKITSQPGYPQINTPDAKFDVITDDGWKFRCLVSGDDGKNLRSEGDLKIIGKWLKGRLEQAGVLKVGELATKEMLEKYGRDKITMCKTKTPGLWFLDFGVNE